MRLSGVKKLITTFVVEKLATTTSVVYICPMESNQLPSEGEIFLLRALWQKPDATVQEVHEWLTGQGKEVGYTTVLTQLQRMHKKGLVSRSKEGKQHLYRAAYKKADVEAGLIDRVSDAVFGGSAVRLALRALGKDQPSAEELDQLQSWLDQQKNNRK